MTTRLLLAQHRGDARDHGNRSHQNVKPDHREKQRRNRGYLDPGHDDRVSGHLLTATLAFRQTRPRVTEKVAKLCFGAASSNLCAGASASPESTSIKGHRV